jgi:putative ABC transport system permease protein
MWRLIGRELLADVGVWVGVLIVAAAGGMAGSAVAGLLAAGRGRPLRQGLALDVLASTVTVLTVVAALVVLGTVARLTVTAQRRRYALWKLAGVSDARVTAVVRVQLVLVATVGSTAGCLTAMPVVPVFLTAGLLGTQGLGGLTMRADPLTTPWVVLAVTGVVWAGCLAASGHAGRVPATAALRAPSGREARMTWARWLAVGIALLLAALMTVGLATGGLAHGGSQILLIGPVVTLAAVAAGPVLFPLVHRGWTALVPMRSTAWFLALTTVDHDIGRSTATISPLVVTIALPGSIAAGFATFGDAIAVVSGHHPAGPAAQSLVLFLAGPLLLSVVGAAATMLMSARTRDQESALLLAAGATPALTVARSALESLMHVVTAMIVAGLAIAVTAIGAAVALDVPAPGTRPGFGVVPAAVAGAVCLLVVVVAGTVPAVLNARRPVTRAVLDR